MELLTYVFKDGTVETTLAKAKARGEDYKIKLVPYEKPFKATPKRKACLEKAGFVNKTTLTQI
jgi:hypothetical protein